MQLPVVHLEIINELGMSCTIFNIPMPLKKSFYAIGVPLGLHSGANIVIETWQS
jgi:hypothetical protein